MASVIEHFAPAIISNDLTVTVDDTPLDASNIAAIAKVVQDSFVSENIREDPKRFISLLQAAYSDTSTRIKVKSPYRKDLHELKEMDEVVACQEDIQNGKRIKFEITFPMEKSGVKHPVKIVAAAELTPKGYKAFDRLYRSGMALPKIKSAGLTEIDLILLADDEMLSNYMNLCEGKAHLDLLESGEVKDSLEKSGFSRNCAEKRFIKALPDEIRRLLTPNMQEPNADIFADFFAIPSEEDEKKSKSKRKKVVPPKPEGPILPKPQSSWILTELEDGFSLKANNEFESWPTAITTSFAYANGSAKPSWEPDDFRLKDLDISYSGCKVSLQEDASKKKCAVLMTECCDDFSVTIRGFDKNLELATNTLKLKE